MRQNIELRLVEYNYIHTCFEKSEREAIKGKLWGMDMQLVGRTSRWGRYHFSEGWLVCSLGGGGTFLLDSWRKARHVGTVLPGPGQICGAGIRNFLLFLPQILLTRRGLSLGIIINDGICLFIRKSALEIVSFKRT